MFDKDVQLPDHIVKIFQYLIQVLTLEQYRQLKNFVTTQYRKGIQGENIAKNFPNLRGQLESSEIQVRNLDRENAKLRTRIAQLESQGSTS